MSERSVDAPTILICSRHGFFRHVSIGVQIGYAPAFTGSPHAF